MLEGCSLPLFFVFSARSDDLLSDSELIPSLAKVNFLRVAIGVETPNPELTKQIGKEISLQKHKQAFGRLREAGIYSVASFIVGLPNETEQMRQDYVTVACELADSATFVPFIPLPETQMGNSIACKRPQQWSIDCAARLTNNFRQNPLNIQRLLQAAKEPTIRGLLAKRSLQKRVADNILDRQLVDKIKQS
jgi:anaerobic magnesium-protoporphyrin IX monomethyl ester cyclase